MTGGDGVLVSVINKGGLLVAVLIPMRHGSTGHTSSRRLSKHAASSFVLQIAPGSNERHLLREMHLSTNEVTNGNRRELN